MAEELSEIMERIRELRNSLHRLIDEKGSVLDPEVIARSKALDDLLNRYESLVKKNGNYNV